MSFAAIDGKIFPTKHAQLPLDDLGFLRGLGVFENFRTYNKRPFLLRKRYDKLKSSGAALGISLNYSYTEVEELITTLIEKSSDEEVTLRLILTGGSSADGLTIDHIPRFIILMAPLKPLPGKYTQNGIRLVTTQLKRPFPSLKTLDYLSAILALRQAQEKGADDALYIDEKEGILETTTANFFAFEKDKLITTNSHAILPGITRQVVIELYQQIEYKKISPSSLEGFSEAFTTSSIKGILPVVSIDDQPIGNGKVGPQTQKLIKAFTDYAYHFQNPVFA